MGYGQVVPRRGGAVGAVLEGKKHDERQSQ